MTEGWTGGGTPDENDLTRRIEELANRAAEEMDAEDGFAPAPAAPAAPVAAGGGVAVAEVANVRAEIGALRAELSSLGERVTSAIAAQGSRLAESIAPLSERIGEGSGGDDGSLEARLAALEDTLSLVAERLESLTSDGASVTGERIGELSRDLGALQSALAAGQQELRGLVASGGGGGGGSIDTAPLVDAQQRTAQAVISRVDESVGGLSSSVREAIDAFARSVERSLTALGGSVGAALAEARDAHHDHLDEVASSLDAPLQRMAVLYNDLVARVEAGGGGGGGGREEMAAVINGLQQIGGVQAQLARAVDELRQSGTTDLTGSIDALRQATAAEFGKLRAELVAVMSSGQDRSIAAMEEADKLTGGRLVELKRSLEKTTKGIETMTTAVEDSAAVLSRMDESWVDISRQTAEEVHAAASEELGTFRAAATKELESLRKSLKDTASGVLAARSEIDQGTRLLVAAGQSLLQYLAERDQVLEEERVRIFRDVLEEFGKGLNAKSRKHLTDRIDEALERHRDARDADRWRRKGAEAAKPAPIPLVVAPEEPPTTLTRDQAKAAAAGETVPLTPVVAVPRTDAPTPVRAAKTGEAAKPAKAGKAAPRPVAKKSASSAPAAKKAAKPAKPAPTAARTAAAKAAKAALAKKSGTSAAKPAARKAAAKKGRASVDRLPDVSSPSNAIDAAAGPDVSLEIASTDAQAAIDAFTQAAGGAGRRPRS